MGMNRLRLPLRQVRRRRRGSVLAEFVLFLPFVFFIMAMIHHYGVSTLRIQRTIVASRYATDYPGDSSVAIQWRFLPKVPVDGVTRWQSPWEDGLDRLRDEVELRDATLPGVMATTRTFWEREAQASAGLGDDGVIREHRYGRGARVRATYRPDGPYYERLQGPVMVRYARETLPWAYPNPDMWWELTRSAPGLSELRDELYEMSRNPLMDDTARHMYMWMRR
jgi:hypothetical protein